MASGNKPVVLSPMSCNGVAFAALLIRWLRGGNAKKPLLRNLRLDIPSPATGSNLRADNYLIL